MSMNITSPIFQNGEAIPKKYSCDGENINPELRIGGVPENAKSLALIADDPDAPMGTFTHWLVWNIDPKTTVIGEGSVPSGGAQGLNDRKREGYTGPCPPSGVHHYHFKLYALNATLDLPQNVSKADLEAAINAHLVASAELVGLYAR